MAQKIDDLYSLRSLLRQSVEAEKELSAEVSLAIRTAGRDRADGITATAILSTGHKLKIDPGLFVASVGPAKAYPAMTVSVTAARELLGEQDIEALSETSTYPILRVEAR